MVETTNNTFIVRFQKSGGTKWIHGTVAQANTSNYTVRGITSFESEHWMISLYFLLSNCCLAVNACDSLGTAGDEKNQIKIWQPGTYLPWNSLEGWTYLPFCSWESLNSVCGLRKQYLPRFIWILALARSDFEHETCERRMQLLGAWKCTKKKEFAGWLFQSTTPSPR